MDGHPGKRITDFASSLRKLSRIYGHEDDDDNDRDKDDDNYSAHPHREEPHHPLRLPSSLKQSKLTGPDSYTRIRLRGRPDPDTDPNPNDRDYRTSSRKSDGYHPVYSRRSPPPDDGYKDAEGRRRDEEERRVRPRMDKAAASLSSSSPMPTPPPFLSMKLPPMLSVHGDSKPEILGYGDFPGVGLQALHSASKAGLRMAGGTRYKRVQSADFQGALRELSPCSELACAVSADVCIGIFARTPVKTTADGIPLEMLSFSKGSPAYSILMYCMSGIRMESTTGSIDISAWDMLTGRGLMSGYKPVLCVVLDGIDRLKEVHSDIALFLERIKKHARINSIHFFGDGEGILVGWVHILGRLFDNVFADL